MDNHFPEDIDNAFKQRFTGLKDHRVDPAARWAAFEAKLSAASTIDTASVASASSSSWASAASLIGIVSTAALLAGDVTLLNSFHTETESITQVELRVNDLTSEAAGSAKMPTNMWYQNTGDVAMTRAEQEVKELSIEPEEGEYAAEEGLGYLLRDSTQDAMALNTGEMRESITKMPLLTGPEPTQGIIDQADLAYQPLKVSVRNHAFYVRGAMRSGTGESNASCDEAAVRLNGMLAVGYDLFITKNVYASVEIGYLRRTGNGLERSKKIDMSPVYNVLNSSYGFEQSRSEIDVRESLVATNLDVIHAPILLHVALNSGNNVSIGFYADRLIRASNESYVVYDGKDYVTTDIGISDAHSKAGLNATRLGILAGYEHRLNAKLSTDVRLSMPITGAFDANSGYDIQRQANQSIDVQVGLNYRL